MSLIKKANELNVQTRIKMLIYGQAGMGKTTLALSAPKPLLIDFDNGVNRVNYAHIKDTVQIESYYDLLSVLNNEDLSPFETIVIDTGGKMLDAMATYIIANNPKLGRSNGMLTQQGYGQRKAEFTALLRLLYSKNKDVVFVAHRKSVNDNDETRYVPLFGGSNYDDLVTELDLVGYLEANGRKRTITFDPTSRNDGKNTCNLPSVMEIPEIVDAKGNAIGENNFLSDTVFTLYRNRLIERSVEGKAYATLMGDLDDKIEKIENAEQANAFVASINSYNHIGNSKSIAAKKFQSKCISLGLIYNKKEKTYSDPEPKPQPQAQPQAQPQPQESAANE